ncbi:MAG: hypothetical protein J5935_02325 [Lachnospiraceae bacterium]|nr:hypothetical protein [Lachnospiraceae bacterium]
MKRIVVFGMILTLLLSGCSSTATVSDQVTSAQEAVEEKKEQLEEAASQLETVIEEAVEKAEELTAELLLERMLAEMETVKSAQEKTNVDMQIRIAMSDSGLDFGMDMKLGMNILSDVSLDPVAAHMLMDYNYEMFGTEEKQEAEVYMEEKDGKIVTYTKDGENWYSMEQEMEEVDTSYVYNRDMFEMLNRDGVTMTLAEEKENINGADAYRIDVTLEGELIAEVMNEMVQSEDAMFDMDSVDWDGLTTDLQIYIREDDNRLAALVMDLTPIGETAIAQAMNLAEDAEELQGVDIAINEFMVRADFLEYDIDPVVIPEEVSAESNKVDITEDEDGSLKHLQEVIGDKALQGDITKEDMQAYIESLSDEELEEIIESLSEEELWELLEIIQ